MRRETQNVLLILLGGALLKISFTGTFLRYVKPSHKWLLIAAGGIMVGLALVSILRDLVNARVASSEGHHHSSRSAWLLLLPVLAVFLVAPPALGADSVAGTSAAPRSSSAQEDGSALFPPLPAGEVVDVPLSDFASRAAWDRGNSLDGRAVRLTGFVVHDGSATYVARLVIACCAADAFPVKVKLDNPQVTGLRNDTWVDITATVVPGSATRANDFVPSATVVDVREIAAPEDPYEH